MTTPTHDVLERMTKIENLVSLIQMNELNLVATSLKADLFLAKILVQLAAEHLDEVAQR